MVEAVQCLPAIMTDLTVTACSPSQDKVRLWLWVPDAVQVPYELLAPP